MIITPISIIKICGIQHIVYESKLVFFFCIQSKKAFFQNRLVKKQQSQRMYLNASSFFVIQSQTFYIQYSARSTIPIPNTIGKMINTRMNLNNYSRRITNEFRIKERKRAEGNSKKSPRDLSPDDFYSLSVIQLSLSSYSSSGLYSNKSPG